MKRLKKNDFSKITSEVENNLPLTGTKIIEIKIDDSDRIMFRRVVHSIRMLLIRRGKYESYLVKSKFFLETNSGEIKIVNRKSWLLIKRKSTSKN